MLQGCRAYWISVLVLAIAGCTQKNEYIPPPPPEVTVQQPVAQEVAETAEFTGTTKPFEVVDITARVEGFLEEIAPVEGEFVAKGTELFKIDPRPFEAAVEQAEAAIKLGEANEASAQAELLLAQAEVSNAEVEMRRVESLPQGAVTEEEIDRRRTNFQKAQAAVQAAQAVIQSAQAEVAAGKAALKDAKLDLEFCTVVAPIDGRVGEKQFDVGSLVGTPTASLLTTMVSYDPIYAYFNVSEVEYLRFRKEKAENAGRADEDGSEPVDESEGRPLRLALSIEDDFPHEGVMDFADLAVDESTGTYMVRGRFDNPDLSIPPGAFVRIQASSLEKKPVLLVPEDAITRDQNGAYVLVVNSDDVVEIRRVDLGGKHDNLQIIRGGELTADERVVVLGLQMARPGAKVTPVEASDSSPTDGQQ